MRSIISTVKPNNSHVVKVLANTRSAFTLVELMVVVAIMAILGALVAGVVVKAIEAQKNSNTKTTMEVIKSALSKQLQAVIDDGKDKEKKGTDNITAVATAAFPDNLSNAKANPKSIYYRNYLSKNSLNNVQDTDIEAKAILLRMILDAGPFSKLETDMLPKGAIATDKQFILDAWGDSIKLNITRPGGTKIRFELKSDNISETISN